MGIRRKIAYVYPGIHKTGVGVLVIDGDEVRKAAVGSIENYLVGPLLEVLRIDELVLSLTKIHDREHAKVPIPHGVKKIRYMAPGWEKRSIPVTDRTHPTQGVYVHNVWKMLFHDGITRKGTKLKDFKVDRFDRDWVLDNSPKGFSHDRRHPG
jgi:hypothetical protein